MNIGDSEDEARARLRRLHLEVLPGALAGDGPLELGPGRHARTRSRRGSGRSPTPASTTSSAASARSTSSTQVERFANEVLPRVHRRESEVTRWPLSSSRQPARRTRRSIVDVCFSVEEGDVVTIICDDDRDGRGARRRRGLRRARRMAGDHEQRDAGAPRPGGRPLPDGAAGEPAPRDGRLGRGDHHRRTSSGRTASPTSTRSARRARRTARSRRSSPAWASGA